MIGSVAALDLPRILLLLFISIPFVVVIYMFWLAWTRGGDPARDSIAVQYEPPDNLTPAECGGLVENAVALRAIAATIANLSVRGYFTIEPKEKSDSSGEAADYVFHRTKPLSELGELKRHEREVLTSIFVPTNPMLLLSQSMAQVATAEKAAGHEGLSAFTSDVVAQAKQAADTYGAMSGFSEAARDSVAMSDLQYHFPLHLARIRDAVFNQLVAAGYYGTRPDRIRMVYATKGIAFGLLMALAGGILGAWIKMAPLILILVGLFSGAVVVGFGFFLPARTRSGACTFSKVLGFREFLGRVEKDHIERLEKSPELFEKYLPYAMALSVENRWAQAFADIAITPPQWYQGKSRNGFLPMHLTEGLNQMSNQAATFGTSTPPSRS
jgi:hypothetical protein